MTTYARFEVPVTGGTLRGGAWGTTGPVVLCAHGITANHLSFESLGDQLGGEARVIAVDNRGRGGSRDIAGPWGMKHHAADMIAVLDHFGAARADVVVGHSMGGFTAAVTAALYPDRVGGIVMVDGGVPVLRMAFVTRLPFGDRIIEWMVKRVIGPSLTRLDMTFASREAYLDYWRPHPSLAGQWNDYVEHYLEYDLVGTPPALRPSTRREVILADVRSQLEEDLVAESLRQLRHPVRFLRAGRGVMNGKPLYALKRFGKLTARLENFVARTLDDVNHFTILLSQRGGAEVAAEVRALLAR